MAFAEIGAAQDWGLTPGAFRALDEEDRALMMAHSRSAATMRAWEQQEQEREMKRASRR